MNTMTALVLLTLMLLVGPLAVLYGADSSIYEERPRTWKR
jgi:hypothetical protein